LAISAKSLVELVLRDVERTAIDAITAADAGVGIVGDDAGNGVFLHRADRTDRDAGRIDTVQTMALDESVTVLFAILPLHRAVLVDPDHVQGLAGNVFGRVPGSSFQAASAPAVQPASHWRLQALTQALQPTHRVESYSMPTALGGNGFGSRGPNASAFRRGAAAAAVVTARQRPAKIDDDFDHGAPS
jgi:hypothetical protein